MQVTVRDLMTSQPPTVGELTTLEEATRMVLDRALNELYVVDENGRLLGTVSDYSLLKARMIKSDAGERVSRFMSRSMLLLSPDMKLDEVSGFFRESCHSRLAVVERGRVIGQLSRRNVLRTMLVLDDQSADSNDGGLDARVASGSVDSSTIRRVEPIAAAVPPEPSGLRPVESADTRAPSNSDGSLVVR